MHRLMWASRLVILLAVFGCALAAVTLLVYEAVASVRLAFDAADGVYASKGTKKLFLAAIEIVDGFLLATVFYITALGLYELFIDSTVRVPEWLEINTLDDLKAKLIGVVVTVLAVAFLGFVLTWDGSNSILALGGAVALVIAALSLFLKK